jgi:hypothetical protein
LKNEVYLIKKDINAAEQLFRCQRIEQAEKEKTPPSEVLKLKDEDDEYLKSLEAKEYALILRIEERAEKETKNFDVSYHGAGK